MTAAAADITVIIPAYNEQENLIPAVTSIHDVLQASARSYEIVIVNDGSSDATVVQSDELAAGYPQIRVIHKENGGIGSAFRAGLSAAMGRYTMLWPADMLASADGLSPYLDALGTADVIVGCRRKREGYNILMQFNSWLYAHLVALLFRLRLRDVNWICLYATDRLRAVAPTQDGIVMFCEILVGIRDAGGTLLQVDVDMQPRLHGQPSAGRFTVMLRTLIELLAFGWHWRRSQPRT